MAVISFSAATQSMLLLAGVPHEKHFQRHFPEQGKMETLLLVSELCPHFGQNELL
jgi:hypothetical protein